MAELYSIGAAARLTGLPAETLRAWERRYGLVAPARDDSGLRHYSVQDIARLQLASRLRALGHPIRRIGSMSEGEMRAIADRADPLEPKTPSQQCVRTILESIERYDVATAERVLNDAALYLPAQRLCGEVLSPLMCAVGSLWESGRLSIAQEHVLSQLVRDLLGRFNRVHLGPADYSVLLATPPHERHEFGIALAAALATAKGVRVCVLGVDVPASDVLAAARRLRPRAVALGVTRALEPGSLDQYLTELRARLPLTIKLWVGGEGARADRAGWGGAEYLPTHSDFLKRTAEFGAVPS